MDKDRRLPEQGVRAPARRFSASCHPGEKLRIETLQEHFQVGASPIRENPQPPHLRSTRRAGPTPRIPRCNVVRTTICSDLIRARRTVERGGGPGVAPSREGGVELTVVFAYHRMWRCPMKRHPPARPTVNGNCCTGSSTPPSFWPAPRNGCSIFMSSCSTPPTGIAV